MEDIKLHDYFKLTPDHLRKGVMKELKHVSEVRWEHLTSGAQQDALIMYVKWHGWQEDFYRDMPREDMARLGAKSKNKAFAKLAEDFGEDASFYRGRYNALLGIVMNKGNKN